MHGTFSIPLALAARVCGFADPPRIFSLSLSMHSQFVFLCLCVRKDGVSDVVEGIWTERSPRVALGE